MITENIGGLHGELVVQATVALFVEPDAAGYVDAGPSDRSPPLIDRRRLDDAVHRAGVERFDQEVVRQSAIVADGLVVAAVVERAEPGGGRFDGEALPRCGPLKPLDGSPKNDASIRWAC